MPEVEYLGPLPTEKSGVEYLGPLDEKESGIEYLGPLSATGATISVRTPESMATSRTTMSVVPERPAEAPIGADPNGAMGTVKNVAVDVAKGVVGFGESMVGIADMFTGNLTGKALEAVGYDPKTTKKILEDEYSPERKEANRRVSEAKGFVDTVVALVKDPSVAAGGVLESAPMMLGIMGGVRTVAVTALKRAGIALSDTAAVKAFLSSPVMVKTLLKAGAISEGAITAGQIQEGARQEGRTWGQSILPAVAAGAGTAAISYGTSLIPGLKDVEVSAVKALLGAGERSTLLNAGKTIAKGVFKEGALEEMPQSLQEQIFTNLAMGKPWKEGVPEAAAQGLVVGSLQAGALATSTEVYNRVRPAAPAPDTPVSMLPSAKPKSEFTFSELNAPGTTAETGTAEGPSTAAIVQPGATVQEGGGISEEGEAKTETVLEEVPDGQSRISQRAEDLGDQGEVPGRGSVSGQVQGRSGQYVQYSPELAAEIPGNAVSRPHFTYPDAVKKTDSVSNPWVRRSADPDLDVQSTSNDGRTLMVQFGTTLLGKTDPTDQSVQYYDETYATVPGYKRLTDFWEIPQWMGFISHINPNADVYVVRDMEAAKRFIAESGYTNLVFSAIDVNQNLIKDLAADYAGNIDIGGYVESKMADLPNATWHDSLQSYADKYGLQYTEGTDYRHFEGSEVIPRLTMSQGCKFKCAFCTVPKDLTTPPKEAIFQQARSFGKLKAKLVYLNDKTFGQAPNYKMLSEVNKVIKAENPDFDGFIIQTTAGTFNKFDTEWLAESGIKFVELGVESYNDDILRPLHKPHTEALIDKAAQKLRDTGIKFIPNIIVGIQEETSETYERTLQFLRDNSDIVSHANVYNLAIYQGSELASKIAVAEAGDVDENVGKKSFHTDETIHREFEGKVYQETRAIKDLRPGQQEDEEYKFHEVPSSSVSSVDEERRIMAALESGKTAHPALKQAETALSPAERSAWKKIAKLAGPAWFTDHNIKAVFGTNEETKLQRLRKVLELYNFFDPTEMAAISKAGKEGLGWYENCRRFINHLFPIETMPYEHATFAQLLAATSVGMKPGENLEVALRAWMAWDKAKRPSDVSKLEKIFNDKFKAGIRADVIRKKIIDVFSGQYLGKLGNFKQPNYSLNIRGVLDLATADMWVARHMAFELLNPADPITGLRDYNTSVKQLLDNPMYIAFAARAREVANSMGLKVAEVQETMWSFVRVLYDALDPKVDTSSTADLFAAEDPVTLALNSISHLDIANVEDYLVSARRAVTAKKGKLYDTVKQFNSRSHRDGQGRFSQSDILGIEQARTGGSTRTVFGDQSKDDQNILRRFTEYLKKVKEEMRKYQAAEKALKDAKKDAVSETRGQGAPKEFRGKIVTLTHWSNQEKMKATDPSKHGTKGAGAERASKQMHPKLWLDKTYWGFGTYTAEPYVGPYRYSAQVNGNDLYDSWEDPLKLYPTDAEMKKAKLLGDKARNLLFEKKIQAAGYIGFVSTPYQAVAIFEPVKVTREAAGSAALPLLRNDPTSTTVDTGTDSADLDFADMGGYAETTSTETQREAYLKQVRSAIELPELVQLVKELSDGKAPKVMKFLKGAVGRFFPAKGRIGVLASMSQADVAKTLAHEIGHLADWLPNKDLKRGNILGRLASASKYDNSLLAEYPDSPNVILTDADRARMRAEAERQLKAEEIPDRVIVQEIIKEVPEYEQTSITPEMILDIMRGRTNDPAIILRFMQLADSATKKAVVLQAMKGIVDERVKALGGVGRQIGTKTITETVEVRMPGKYATEAEIKKRFNELLKEEIQKRQLFEKETIIAELKKLSMRWKPFNPDLDRKYTRYRWSSEELYADAISVLLNNPRLMETTAPTFTKAFFNYLDRKPTFKEVYDGLQELVKDPAMVMTKRRERYRGMAQRDVEIQNLKTNLLTEQRKFGRSKLWHEVMRTFVRKEQKAFDIARRLSKEGRKVRDEHRIEYWFTELPYINSIVSAFSKQVDDEIVIAADKEGISIVDLHEYMGQNRAATERADINNPGGESGPAAKAHLERMRQDMGDAKFNRLADYAFKFRALYEKHVLNVVADADFLPKKLVDYMLNNPDYATFVNLEYEIDKVYGTGYGSGPTAHIYKQYGMLGDVANVFGATLAKGMALIRAAEHHKTKMGVLEGLITEGNVAETMEEFREMKQNGTLPDVIKARPGAGGVFMPSPDADYGLIVVTPNGKTEGYYIDKELADMWAFNPDRAHGLLKLGMAGKAFIARLFIQWNLGWTLMNPIRDSFGTWQKMPEVSGYLMKGYKRTFTDAIKAGWGITTERELRLLREKKLTAERFWNSDTSYHQQEEEMLRRMADPTQYPNTVGGIMKRGIDYLERTKLDRFLLIPMYLRFVGKLGKAGERWAKYAAEEAVTLKEQATGIRLGKHEKTVAIIERAGTPNSLSGGLITKWTEIIFPFANIATQDLVSTSVAIKNKPATYAMKTFIANVMPHILFATMVAGWWGGEEGEIAKTAKKAGRYLRRMYTTIPIPTAWIGTALEWILGKKAQVLIGMLGDKGVFITIPQSYSGQMTGAIVDAAITRDFTGSMGALGLVTGAQPYNLHPLISSVIDWTRYYANGVIPVNTYYGSPTMSEEVAKAGGMRAFESLSKETWNGLFGGLVYKFQGTKVEEMNNEIKDVLGIVPFNTIGRLLRVSDTGTRERAQDVVNEERKIAANKSLDLKDKMIDATNKGEGADFETARELWLTAVETGQTNQSLKEFYGRYRDLGTRKEGNVYVNSFRSAATSAERAALLILWEKELPAKDYENVYEKLQKNRWITPPVIRKKKEMEDKK
jgi:hypothetical protein